MCRHASLGTPNGGSRAPSQPPVIAIRDQVAQVAGKPLGTDAAKWRIRDIAVRVA
jgi:hypothetical protein